MVSNGNWNPGNERMVALFAGNGYQVTLDVILAAARPAAAGPTYPSSSPSRIPATPRSTCISSSM